MSNVQVGFQAMKIDVKDEDDFPFINFEVEPDTYLPPARLKDGTPVFSAEPCWFLYRGRLVLGVPIWFPKEATYENQK